MVAYKLVRLKKNGDITSLFINKKEKLMLNEWLQAKSFPTKGFALRPKWHCTAEMTAPHLSEKGRVWVELEMKDFEEFSRPKTQGGMWYLADSIKINKIISLETR